MKKEPLVSIVMTAYNVADKITETLDAILMQDYKNFELLISDDGSTDATAKIIQDYQKKDERIKIFLCEHQGRAKILNFTIKQARGEYIAINDADDLPAKDKFVKQINFLEQNKDYGMIGSQGYLLYVETGNIRNFDKPLSYEEIYEYLIIENPFIHSAVIFRKEVFDKIGYYNEYFTKLGIEYELWSRVLKHYKVCNLEDRLLYYKVHNNNVYRKRNCFIIFKHQFLMRILIFKRLQYPLYKAFYILYIPLKYFLLDFIKKYIFLNKIRTK
ncbi:MAG TPA: glycosyltransferase family A protein [bacterium]|nr:glycosyltransferase family A protein [bacterium]HPP86323.1 glycosyltransferase family A protein [bacterium]